MSGFKSLQVLRTTAPLRNAKGHPIAVGSRVVFIKQDGDQVIARRQGVAHPAPRITGTVAQFELSPRGRPVGSTKA